MANILGILHAQIQAVLWPFEAMEARWIQLLKLARIAICSGGEPCISEFEPGGPNSRTASNKKIEHFDYCWPTYDAFETRRPSQEVISMTYQDDIKKFSHSDIITLI